ncbi:MAG TPA: hypothetical protein VJ464_12100 [Blastocatellia bacterium]|nr:hypothetical protein [Blastocatellia bacterium]
MADPATVQKLLSALRGLAPWGSTSDFSEADWQRYMDAARLVQQSAPADVEQALAHLLDETNGFTGVNNERRLFLLTRVVFDLPDRMPADQRRVFKGWVNWPAPDAEGNVNLSWPLDWQDERPVLLAPYEGSEGPRYGAIEEYRYLLNHFPFRTLRTANGL